MNLIIINFIFEIYEDCLYLEFFNFFNFLSSFSQLNIIEEQNIF